MEPVTKFAIKLNETLDIIARIIFMIIMILVVGNVISRLFGRPFPGCYEWAGFLMASAIGLALAHCAVQEGHVAVTYFIERLTSRTQGVIESTVNIFILIFLIMIFRMLIIYGNRMFISGHVGMTTQIPLYYFVYIISFGFLGYCFVIVVKLSESLKRVVRK